MVAGFSFRLTATVASVLDHGTNDVPWVVPIDHESGPIRVQWLEFNHVASMFVLAHRNLAFEPLQKAF